MAIECYLRKVCSGLSAAVGMIFEDSVALKVGNADIAPYRGCQLKA